MRARPTLLAALVGLALGGCSASAASSRGPTIGPVTGTESDTSMADVTVAPDATALASSTSAGTTVPPPLHPSVTDPRVYVIGDSIAESISSRYSGLICDALGPLGWDVVVDAYMGRRTDEAVRSLRTNRSRVGQVVVVLIGHNDGVDAERYARNIGQLVELVPEARRILLLTNYEFERGRDRMNDVLRQLAAVDGDGGPDDRLQLVDWNGAVEEVDDAISGDGIHLTGDGQRALATVMATALGAAPERTDAGAEATTPACTTLRSPSTSGSGNRPASGSGGGGGSSNQTTTVAPPAGTEPPPATDGDDGGGGGGTKPPATDAPSPSDGGGKPPGTGGGQEPPPSGQDQGGDAPPAEAPPAAAPPTSP